VDCTAQKQTCDEFGVRGFPTIKFFGERKDSPEDYEGARDSGSLAQFATQRWTAQQPPPEVRVALVGRLMHPAHAPHPHPAFPRHRLAFAALQERAGQPR
jgi:hypothetical protein